MNIDLIWQIYMANKVVLNSIMYAHNQPLRSRTFPFDTIDTQSRRAGVAKCERKKRAEAVTGARCHFFIVQYFPSLLAYRFFRTVFLFLLIKQLLKCLDPGKWREDCVCRNTTSLGPIKFLSRSTSHIKVKKGKVLHQNLSFWMLKVGVVWGYVNIFFGNLVFVVLRRKYSQALANLSKQDTC